MWTMWLLTSPTGLHTQWYHQPVEGSVVVWTALKKAARLLIWLRSFGGRQFSCFPNSSELLPIKSSHNLGRAEEQRLKKCLNCRCYRTWTVRVTCRGSKAGSETRTCLGGEAAIQSSEQLCDPKTDKDRWNTDCFTGYCCGLKRAKYGRHRDVLAPSFHFCHLPKPCRCPCCRFPQTRWHHYLFPGMLCDTPWGKSSAWMNEVSIRFAAETHHFPELLINYLGLSSCGWEILVHSSVWVLNCQASSNRGVKMKRG